MPKRINPITRNSSKLEPMVEKKLQGDALSCCTVSSDRSCALVGNCAGKVVLCNLGAFEEAGGSSWKELRKPDGSDITCAAFEGGKVALGSDTGDVRFLDLTF